MIRAWILPLLAAALLAADPFDATPLRWEAGRASLAEAVARLEVGGNRVWLADGVDDRAEAALPAVDGAWWDGVRAVCEAFALRPDEGDAADERMDGQGVPVPVGHGTVVLAPGQPPAMRAAGGLLVALDGDQGIRLWLRAEPRVGRGRMAWGRVESAALGGTALERLEAAGDGERAAAQWHAPDPIPAGGRFAGAIQVAALARWQATAGLAANAEAAVPDAPQRIDVLLATGPERTAWLGMGLPERRPLLAVAVPAELAQGLAMRLRGPDGDLTLRNGGGGATEDGRQILLRYPRNLPDAPLELLLEGRSTLSGRRIEVDLAPPRLQPSPPAPPAEAPSILRWEAGSAPLARWLQALAATGNPVLVEVGVDTAAAVELPAFAGRFWDGVLLLCRASGLAPAAGDAAGVGGGAVRLIRRPLPPAAACGPFLLLGSAAAVRPGQVAIELRCLAEPRLQPESFGPPAAAWATWAEDPAGGAHPLAVPAAEAAPARRSRSGEEAPPLRAEIELARPGVGELVLDGMLTVPRVRLWRATADAAPGQPVEVLLGGRAVELTAHSAPVAVNGSPWGPGLLLRGLVGAQGLHYAVAGGDGAAVDQAGEANRSGGGSPTRPWLAWCRVPAEGRIAVTLAARAASQPLVLPFRLRVALPEGL